MNNKTKEGKKINIKYQTPPKYNNSTLPKYKRYKQQKSSNLLPLFVTNCQRQHQSSEGGGGGNTLLYSAKSALKEATLVNSSFKSYP